MQPISEGRDVCGRGRGNHRKDDVKEMGRDIKGRSMRGAEERGNYASNPQMERDIESERMPTKTVAIFLWPVFVCQNL
jgi:hypothetical protein